MPRAGYCFRGYLGDVKLDTDGHPVDSPDGNATYSWSIIRALQSKGWDVERMYPDLDYSAWVHVGSESMFKSFNEEKRLQTFLNLGQYRGGKHPDLDLLLMEWRFPVAGREDVTLDLQRALLQRYEDTKTEIFIWDLDHKFHDSFTYHVLPKNVHLLENVTPPFNDGLWDWFEFEPIIPSPGKLLSYIGSRYERDDVIDEWIAPISQERPFSVHFYGNWTKYPDRFAEVLEKWPLISYHGRASLQEFREIYSTSAAVPLLAKQSYLDQGFMTARIAEVAHFGSIPIGLGSFKGIEEWLPTELIAEDAGHLKWIAEKALRDQSWRVQQIQGVRHHLADRLDPRKWLEEHLGL